jgi:predicted Zn-dependent peptidase
MKTELIKEDNEFLYLNLFDKDSELKIFSGFGFELERDANLNNGERSDDYTDNEWYGDIPSEDIMDKLSSYYESEDLVNSFRRQDRLINSLQTFSEIELKQMFYEGLSVPQDKTKQEFIELVKEKTQPYFNK